MKYRETLSWGSFHSMLLFGNPNNTGESMAGQKLCKTGLETSVLHGLAP